MLHTYVQVACVSLLLGSASLLRLTVRLQRSFLSAILCMLLAVHVQQLSLPQSLSILGSWLLLLSSFSLSARPLFRLATFNLLLCSPQLLLLVIIRSKLLSKPDPCLRQFSWQPQLHAMPSFSSSFLPSVTAGTSCCFSRSSSAIVNIGTSCYTLTELPLPLCFCPKANSSPAATSLLPPARRNSATVAATPSLPASCLPAQHATSCTHLVVITVTGCFHCPHLRCCRRHRNSRLLHFQQAFRFQATSPVRPCIRNSQLPHATPLQSMHTAQLVQFTVIVLLCLSHRRRPAAASLPALLLITVSSSSAQPIIGFH